LAPLQTTTENNGQTQMDTVDTLVPKQTTIGDGDQTRMETSDTLMGNVPSDMPTGQEKPDVEMSGAATGPHTDAPVHYMKPGAKTSPKAKGKAPPPPLFKAAGSPRKDTVKQPKGGVSGFMRTTAAAAAKSRPPVTKPGSSQ
jgi:hypothetical protein